MVTYLSVTRNASRINDLRRPCSCVFFLVPGPVTPLPVPLLLPMPASSQVAINFKCSLSGRGGLHPHHKVVRSHFFLSYRYRYRWGQHVEVVTPKGRLLSAAHRVLTSAWLLRQARNHICSLLQVTTTTVRTLLYEH